MANSPMARERLRRAKIDMGSPTLRCGPVLYRIATPNIIIPAISWLHNPMYDLRIA